MISVHRMWRNCWATGPTTISNRSSEIVYNVHQALFATWKWMPYSEHTKDVSIVWSGIVPVNYWHRARMTCRSVCGIHFANRWSWTFSHRTMAIYFRWNLCHAAAMGCWRLARVMANCSCTISNRRMWCQYGNVIVIIRGLSVWRRHRKRHLCYGQSAKMAMWCECPCRFVKIPFQSFHWLFIWKMLHCFAGNSIHANSTSVVVIVMCCWWVCNGIWDQMLRLNA